MKDTIVAIATPLLASAIHIIRISGKDSYEILQKLTKDKIYYKGYSIQRCLLENNGELIDDVILVKFIAPMSFNGEDTIEINCHGGVLVTQKILQAILSKGARLAENGEFTKIAFLNNKLSINQCLAINNLINSKTEIGHNIAVNSLVAQNRSKINNICEKLFKLIGNIEVNIDYPEYYDVLQISNEIIIPELKFIKQFLIDEINNYRKIEKVFKGINLAIIGKPNVGKSSLLNALLKEERAIVSNIEGTTRDSINESLIINGVLTNIIDTAGIRNANNKIEKIGILKTKKIIDLADLILFVIDNSKKISLEEMKIINKLEKSKKEFLIIKNKTDLNKQFNLDIDGIKISAKKKEINSLIKELSLKLNSFDLNKNLSSEISNNEQLNYFHNLLNIVDNILKQVNNKTPIDLVTVELNELHNKFLNLIGQLSNFDFYDELFKNFCIGK